MIDQAHRIEAACPDTVADAGGRDGHTEMRLASADAADQHEAIHYSDFHSTEFFAWDRNSCQPNLL